MDSWEPDEIDFEDQYDKADPIDDADLDASMTLLNESLRVQEELQERLSRAEWKSTNKDERTKLEQQEETGRIHHESFENDHINLT